MRVRRPTLLLGALAVAALCGCGATSGSHHAESPLSAATNSGPRGHTLASLPIPRQGSVKIVSFYSRALRRRAHFVVYLPVGYDQGSRAGIRYPVLYLLHPPPGDGLGYFTGGRLAGIADRMVRARLIRPMIMAIPMGHTLLYRDDTEWANDRAGRYESFVSEVVHAVDRRFATVADRSGRGIAGLSEGGYGALNIGLHHLRTFSVLESWSGYFMQTPTGPFYALGSRALYRNSPALFLPRVERQIRRMGLRAYVYQGMRDDVHPEALEAFAPELARVGADVRWGFFPGGHGWGLWRHELPRMLSAASAWFAQPPSAAVRGKLVRSGGAPVPWPCYYHYRPGRGPLVLPLWCRRYANVGVINRRHARVAIYGPTPEVRRAAPARTTTPLLVVGHRAMRPRARPTARVVVSRRRVRRDAMSQARR